MPLVKPFRGLLYADASAEAMGSVLAPPFDMIKGDQQQALFGLSEHNIARLTVADDGPGYPGVRDRFAKWKGDGVLARDAEAALYAYEHTLGDARLRGFLAAVKLAEPKEQAVYPHENTFAEPISDRLTLMRATDCSLEPVLALYEDEEGHIEGELAQVMEQAPAWEAKTTDGGAHRLWRVTDEARQAALAGIVGPRKVVIADGHHRWAVAQSYRDEKRRQRGIAPEAPYEYGLMLLADARTGGVECSAFHRVIQRLPEDIDPEAVTRNLGEHFEVQDFPTDGMREVEAARSLVVAVESEPGIAFGCQWRSGAAIVRIPDLEPLLPMAHRDIDEITQEFDVALLHRLVLRPRLRCHGDFGPQACAVVFEKDPVTAWRRVVEGESVMAWYVKPAKTDSVMRAAFAGKRVPQKATHFYPKPASGIVMYELSE